MGRVADILARKGALVHRIAPDVTAYEAITLMVRSNVGSLLVTSRDHIVGIFTERDFLRRVTLENRDPRATRVDEVMTTQIICVEPAKSVQECMAIMTQERIRHLPVVDGNELVGVISIGDLVKSLSKEQEVEIRYLTEYITGHPPA